jgi:NAD(P)-dependent dehydrogenase (short-subunit alcohol dehydrogenase family)
MSELERRAGLDGKVAVVLGGAQGLGEGICRALAACGVNIALCDVDAAALGRAADLLRTLQREVLAHEADVCDRAALDGFWSQVDRHFQRVDIVVNVVGGVRHQSFLDTKPEQWDADIRCNYGYVVQSCHHAARRMRERGHGGSIVNVTTIEAYRAAPGFSVYAGLKAGVANLSRSLATELAPLGIRLNCVAPDQTPTPGLTACIDPATYDPAPPGVCSEDVMRLVQAQAANAIPLGRMGVPDDVANCVLFLASDLSAYVTGQTLHADGGAMASAGWLNFPGLGFRNRVPLEMLASAACTG